MASAPSVASSVRNCERVMCVAALGLELCLCVGLTWGVTKWLLNSEFGDCSQWMPGDETNYQLSNTIAFILFPYNVRYFFKCCQLCAIVRKGRKLKLVTIQK